MIPLSFREKLKSAPERLNTLFRNSPWEKGLLVAVGLIFLVVALGLIPITHDGLRRFIISKATQSSAQNFALDKVSITLWRGVRLQGLRFGLRLESGDRVEVEAPSAAVSYSILLLIFKHVHIKRFLLDHPRVKLTLYTGPAVPPKQNRKELTPKKSLPELWQSLPVIVSCREFAVNEAAVSVVWDGRSGIFAEGIDLSGDLSFDSVPRLTGGLSIERLLLFEKMEAEKIRVDFLADLDHVKIHNFKGKIFGGHFTGHAAVRPTANQLTAFEMKFDGLDLKEYYRSTGIRYGKLTGRLDLKVHLAESAIHPDSLSGTGRVEMKELRVTSLPFQQAAFIRLSMPELTNISFETIRGDFTVRRGKAFNNPISGAGEPLSFDAKGWVSLDGRFDQALDARLSAAFTHRLPKLVRNGLVVQPDGSYGLKMTIAGTMEHPLVKVDKQNVNQAIGRSLEGLRRGLGSFFKSR